MDLAAIDPPFDLLLAILTAHPAGIKEYDLFHHLRKPDGPLAGLLSEKGGLSDPLVLFRCHFLLFHWLYRLRQQLRDQGEWDLEIHCLGITLRKAIPATDHLPGEVDPLQGYYLNPEPLSVTTRQEVEQMLQEFWQMFQSWDRPKACRNQALATLGLAETASHAEIRQRFHHLVLTHHPDQGGSSTELQRILAAMESLKETP